jgi:SAM-dependent methyltransferase
MAARRPSARQGRAPLTARTADRHALYQLAVQTPAKDAAFYARWFQRLAGRPLRVLREDFCGTAALAVHHVLRHRDNRAIGVDLHWPTLAWGRIHNVRAMLDSGQQRRLRLVHADVRSVRSPKVDAIVALNFSYSVLKTRADLLAYLRAAFASLQPGGVLFADAWGGPDALQAKTDRHRRAGFVYEWEQRAFDPVSHRIECAIHFAFPDGSRMRDAFVYDWRLWTLPELRELFTAAGFGDVQVLWESTDHRTGAGTGAFYRTDCGSQDEAWVALVVGIKPD